jgi:hypothetical protein
LNVYSQPNNPFSCLFRLFPKEIIMIISTLHTLFVF